MREMTTVQAVDHHTAKLSPDRQPEQPADAPVIQLGRWHHACIHHRQLSRYPARADRNQALLHSARGLQPGAARPAAGEQERTRTWSRSSAAELRRVLRRRSLCPGQRLRRRRCHHERRIVLRAQRRGRGLRRTAAGDLRGVRVQHQRRQHRPSPASQPGHARLLLPVRDVQVRDLRRGPHRAPRRRAIDDRSRDPHRAARAQPADIEIACNRSDAPCPEPGPHEAIMAPEENNSDALAGAADRAIALASANKRSCSPGRTYAPTAPSARSATSPRPSAAPWR